MGQETGSEPEETASRDCKQGRPCMDRATVGKATAQRHHHHVQASRVLPPFLTLPFHGAHVRALQLQMNGHQHEDEKRTCCEGGAWTPGTTPRSLPQDQHPQALLREGQCRGCLHSRLSGDLPTSMSICSLRMGPWRQGLCRCDQLS